MFTHSRKRASTMVPESEDEEDEEEYESHLRTCAKGHHPSLLLIVSSIDDDDSGGVGGGGTICLACLSALLSDPSSPTHHVSYALSQLSSAAGEDRSPLNSAARLLVSPLVDALFCSSFTRDETLARQIAGLISDLSSSGDAAGDFVARIADRLSSAPGVVGWNQRHVYSVHCLGVLLDSKWADDPTSHIGDKMALFSNLVSGLQLPSEEIRGEILFVLYKLSDARATPWDDVNCGLDDGDNSSLTGLKLLLLRLSLEALLKTQHDDVRMNCLALLSVLAQRHFFVTLSAMSFKEASCLMQTDEAELRTPLTNLFADAVKGPLLSSDTQVQTRTLDLIFLSLSSDANCGKQIHTFVEENIADYVFEILRLSGKKDCLVISCLQVLILLATAEEAFRQKLAVGFPTLLSVLSYVAEIPLHPAQSQVLQLVWRCILDCPGVISIAQIEEITLNLTNIFRRYTSREVGLQSESLILACSTFVDILKLPSASRVQKLALRIQDATRNLISSSFSRHEGVSNELLLYNLYLLKEAHLYCIANTNSDNKLEASISETCKLYLLPWLERATEEGEEEELVLDVLETFHLILLRGSQVEAHSFAEALASSSWFSLSFRCLGLFPSDEMKSRVYLLLGSILDRTFGHEFGYPIKDAYVHLPSDPLDLLFLLGQKSTYDHDLTCCQRAVLLILYVSSLYGESLANDSQVLASLEQYVIVNSGNFSKGAADSITLTQVVLLNGLFRGTPIGQRAPYSLEAEKKLSHLIVEHEWDILTIGSHPKALKWLFQQEGIMAALLKQMLNFCRLNSSNSSQISIHASKNRIMDISVIAELIVSNDNYMTLVLVSLIKNVNEDSMEDELISVVKVVAGVLDICPDTSNQFCLQGIFYAIHNIYSSIDFSSDIFKICSLLIFKILSSANHRTISEDGEWFPVTAKLLDFLNTKLALKTCGEEGCLVFGIFCLVLHHSTNHVLKEVSMAILSNKSLVSAVNTIVQTVCAKGSGLVDQEAVMGDCLIFVLMLFYFSLKSLYVNFQDTLDWQDFLQSSDEAQQQSVICIKCHDLCRLIHFGPNLVKLVASQCLVEVLTRISEQRNTKQDELRCSSNYLESIMAVTEGLVFYGDHTVAMNCGICLSLILGWEKLGELDMRALNSSKWLRVIVEELVMSLAVPSLASNYFTNQHKPSAHIAAELLRMDKPPQWMRSIFDISCISGIVESISASSVTAEMVMLLRELMTRKYLNKELIVRLHNLFQVCREQVYEGTLNDTFTKPSFGRELGIPGDAGKLCSILLDLILRPIADNEAIQTVRYKLLQEIDMFFHKSSTLL